MNIEQGITPIAFMKLKALIFSIFFFLCLTVQAQFLAPFYSVLQSNRGLGNGKLTYRIYSSTTTSVFPANSAEFDSYLSNYNTLKKAEVVKISPKVGTLNSADNYAVNVINFNGSVNLYTAIGTTTPYSGYSGDGFTLVVSGYFIPKQTGTYKFSVEGDDAVDLYINNTNVVNHYGPHGASTIGTHTGTITLIAGTKYSLRARFMEGAGGEVFQLFWQKPSETSASVWYQDVEELSAYELVPNGLVMALDAGNVASYPQSSTTWFDLQGNANGAIGGNVTYFGANNGNFYFDGEQDYVDFGANPTNFPTGSMSMFMWIHPSTFKNPWNILLTKWFANTAGAGGSTDFHYAIKWNGSNYRQNLYTTSNFDMYGSTSFSTNTWYYVGFTLTNGGNMQFYVNGVADGPVQTGVSRTYYSSNSVLFMGDPRTLTGFQGHIANMSIHNRALSTEEVLQNFNTYKYRYGF